MWEGEIVSDLGGGQCPPLCTQHLQPHAPPPPMSQNTLTSAVSSVRIRNVILFDSH